MTSCVYLVWEDKKKIKVSPVPMGPIALAGLTPARQDDGGVPAPFTAARTRQEPTVSRSCQRQKWSRIAMHQWWWRTNGWGERHTSPTDLGAATTLSCASFAYSHALPHLRPACRPPARETTARMPPPSILLPLSAGSAQDIWQRARKSCECIFARCAHTCNTFDEFHLSLRHPSLFPHIRPHTRDGESPLAPLGTSRE